ncbi:MAG: Gfo/Idh/MocA family protein [Vicinamibacterales bacterium]
MDALRWGLLGTAQITRRLIPAIRANRRSVLTAVGSRDAFRAEAYARQWGIPHAHDGYARVLDDPAVDAVYISLPNSMHAEWTLAAIDAGKHVLCEKPLVLDPEDVDRIAHKAQTRAVTVSEAMMYRHEPLTARAVRFAREHAVGPPRSISAGFTYQQSRAPDVRLDPALGGGSLWDIGCYAVSYARLLAGEEPEEVFGWAQWTPSGVDESFTGLMRFPSGVVATIHSGFRTAYRTWVELAGEDGVMRVPNPFKPGTREDIELQRQDVARRVAVEGSLELFVREVADFVASVQDGRDPVVSLTESQGNAAALQALHESARMGKPVSVRQRGAPPLA